MSFKRIKANSILIDLDDVGPVLIERSKRAKRLIISVKYPNRVRVAVPGGYSFNTAKIYVHNKKAWIKKQQQKMAQMQLKREVLNHHKSLIDTMKARKKLTDRLDYFAKKYGFHYNTISIRNQKTRWGSCSAKNNISLNINLVLLPGKLVDYVILHELLHCRIKNHSQEFWYSLNQYVGNAKVLRLELKEYGITLW
jgi:predicted metal-dependent hydrolase